MRRRDIEDFTHPCSKVGRDAKARKERWKLLWGIRAKIVNVPDTPKGSLDLGAVVSVSTTLCVCPIFSAGEALTSFLTLIHLLSSTAATVS